MNKGTCRLNVHPILKRVPRGVQEANKIIEGAIRCVVSWPDDVLSGRWLVIAEVPAGQRYKDVF
jgi:hypothetical protein